MRDEYQDKVQAAAQGYIGGLGQIRQQSEMNCEAARRSAKSRLRMRIKDMRQEADRLEALANALPEVLPIQADDALWSLLD